MSRFIRVPWLFVLFSLLTLWADTAPASVAEFESNAPVVQASAEPRVTVRAASGATLPFVTQNGKAIGGAPPQTFELPHLVLFRNGALSDVDERTLILELTGIEVPPAGVTVTLTVETQHTDPDARSGAGGRIPVWQELQRIDGAVEVTRTNVTVAFGHEFTETVTWDNETVGSPTDYVRYDITVTDPNHPLADPLYRFSADYVALMENQWIARLPEVLEAVPGAAPDEMIVYYCDMFPFRKSVHEPATWLPRDQVMGFVGTELVPRMVEAFRVQTNEWGFPWYEAWTSYRSEDPERLSVALTDERTWFHGAAPSGGHSGISIRVKGGGNAPFATLTDGIVSTFHHELFHNLQRNINLHSGEDGRVDGAKDAWQFFTEGTAVLAESVGQPAGQFTQTLPARTYISYANGYIWRGGGRSQGLNLHYDELEPYQAAIYWRFLYEQCAGRDPAAGMQIIRRALVALYAGEVVDIHSSTDLVAAIPEVMDLALAGSSCPFQTYRQSLTAFARGLYGLRLDGARCLAPGTPAGCGFYDPYDQYRDPPLSTITYAGADLEVQDGIKSSFGIDLIEVVLDPAAHGQPLALEFHTASASHAEFSVQLWLLDSSREDLKPRRIPVEAAATNVLTRADPDGRLFYAIPAIRMTAGNVLGLVITRLDAREDLDPGGEYTIVLRPGASQRGTGVSDRAYGEG